MKRLTLWIAALSLGGCNLAPDYERPDPSVPASWPEGEAYAPANAAPPTLSYQEVFQDPKLQALIARALVQNQDLAAALANVEITRAQYRGQRGQIFLPRVDASVSTTETGGDLESSQSQAQLGDAAFELDLFGRLRNLSHAAQQQYLASESAARAARLTLIGDIAQTYATLAADRTLLAIASDTQASAQRTVELTEARLNGGVAPRGELSQARTVLQQALSDVATQKTNVARDRNALQLLVGGPVADSELPESIENLASAFVEVPAGLNSQVLLARPDVAQAEYRLQASYAQIGVARAAFFPNISLTALAGLASEELGDLFSDGAFTWRTGVSATVPLFAAGANRANLDVTEAQRDLALAQYQKAIQSAFSEIADALARRGTIRDQLNAQETLVSEASLNLELSTARYQAGVDPYLNTLDAQRTLYNARRSLTSARLAEIQNLAQLYKALGGDPLQQQ
ncbi:MAG: efflux transporter outer membrane subunit [Pseudomonadales bacterium]|jgi:multidrug efflux system outer membrane protein|nr:efflux transporter outer membrane subunit [Pseudomonadales bacterium]